MAHLAEIDSLEIEVVVDNEVDPMSSYTNEGIEVGGRFVDVAIGSTHPAPGRANAVKELRLDSLCCGAHGLSLMITATKGDTKHTMLFDTGPEEQIWDMNAKRLRADLAKIETIHLSHWHKDHSGGMLRAIPLINAAKKASPSAPQTLVADLHPARPDYRGFMTPMGPISLEADPSFEEISAAGATVSKHAETHTVLDDMFLISGEIPRVTPYEVGVPRGARFSKETGMWEPDEKIADERFVMCNVKGKGLVVFSGCSHAGVVNVTKNAVDLGNGVPLFSVMGGYHLVQCEDSTITETVADLKKMDPKLLLPGHCSGWKVKYEINKEMPGRLAPSTVGTKFKI
ncbi:metallo-beta-lactamase superfamily protein [Rhizodiscina lignyota]|uniref:Metallo-beta-lactamase superfamily protein n=1 Tax=Rhizodiscina lignyota TaxID=1504668 RepID=A0A9P4M4F3_9PEZI|nr:metallo-beta-lactamase superfamily protein [Rhizodiscina lignyota]